MKFYHAVICAMVLDNICCYEAAIVDSFVNVKAQDECIIRLKLSANESEMIKKGKFITKDEKASHKNLQCYSLCYHKKINIVNDKMELNEKVLTGLMSEPFKGDQNRIKTAIDKCKITTGADDCEKSLNFEVCLRDQL